MTNTKKVGLFDIAKLAITKKGITIAVTLSLAFGAGVAANSSLTEPKTIVEEVIVERVVEPPKPEISTGQEVHLGDGGSIPGLSIVYEFEYNGTPYRCFRWRTASGQDGSLSCSPM